MSVGHDYTAEDRAGYVSQEDIDNFLIGNVAAGDKSADQIESENYFAPVPPGEQILEVVGFIGKPQEAYHKAFVNGQLVGYSAFSVGVRLGMPGQQKRTVTDFFTLPPADPKGRQAYYYGVPEDMQNPGQPSKMQAGVDGNRFSHFINRLGYNFPPGGTLPPEAQKLGNWRGRKIVAMVKAGVGTYVGKDGKERQRDSKVQWFSYKPAEGWKPGAAATQNGTQAASKPVASNAAAAASMVNTGLDNI